MPFCCARPERRGLQGRGRDAATFAASRSRRRCRDGGVSNRSGIARGFSMSAQSRMGATRAAQRARRGFLAGLGPNQGPFAGDAASEAQAGHGDPDAPAESRSVAFRRPREPLQVRLPLLHPQRPAAHRDLETRSRLTSRRAVPRRTWSSRRRPELPDSGADSRALIPLDASSRIARDRDRAPWPSGRDRGASVGLPRQCHAADRRPRPL